jgi:hypothetical protein
MDTFQSNGFAQRPDRIGDVAVRVSSYSLAKRFSAQVENTDGGVIGRGLGDSREAAEAAALSNASVRLGLAAAAESFRRSVTGNKDEPPR